MASPLSRAAVARIVPFAAFMLLLVARGTLPIDGSIGLDPRWVYGAAVLIVGALLAWFWREYGELVRQTLPSASEAALALVVGMVVFVLWTTLDAAGARLGEPSGGLVPT